MMKQLIKFDNMLVEVEFKDEKVVTVTGDKVLADIVKQSFKKPISVMTGIQQKKIGIFISKEVKLSPGGKGFVDAVLLERIRNEMGMTLTTEQEQADVNENNL